MRKLSLTNQYTHILHVLQIVSRNISTILEQNKTLLNYSSYTKQEIDELKKFIDILTEIQGNLNGFTSLIQNTLLPSLEYRLDVKLDENKNDIISSLNNITTTNTNILINKLEAINKTLNLKLDKLLNK